MIEYHHLWQSKDIWGQLLKRSLEYRLTQDMPSDEVEVASEVSQEGEMSFMQRIGKMMSDKPVKEPVSPSLPPNKSGIRQTIVYGYLTQYIQYFVSYRVPSERARGLLLHFVKAYGLDKQRTHILISELYS